ncbi:MAG TPA: hypothetical protein VFK14_12380 [Solirubrobacterales bacterium]|nr:hypothetical protein [Solirubrobacterales bacterium]
MNKHGGTNPLLIVLLIWLALLSVGPILVLILHAAVPLVIAGGIVFVLVRLVLHHTHQW